MLEVVALVLQLYVVAPFADSIIEFPEHIVALLTVTVGLGVTVILFVAVFLQPFTSVPVAV
jgi:hypothetical protein